MNWFQRHLNWTLVLTYLTPYLIIIILGTFGVLSSGSVPTIPEALFLIICFIAGFFVFGWVLRRKNRSLWWLLMVFVPFGFIVWLGLENRSQQF